MSSDGIPGFTRHGQKWQARVVLDEADARAVAARAEADGVGVATVLRMLVRRALGRRERAS